MSLKALLLIACLFAPFQAQEPTGTNDLRNKVESTPTLPFKAVPFATQPPSPGWQSGAVSSVAIAPDGLIYELQRGEDADPVLVLNKSGKILRSWGKGDFKLPHTIRLDPAGHVWTVDANSSTVIEYSSTGKKLLTIKVGGQPKTENPFDGTTDIAFAPNGHLFITDGYANARVLEYTAQGKLIDQWGKRGTAAGEFHLPHALQIDRRGNIYVADRENGRIQKFDAHHRFLVEFPHLGRVYSIKLDGNVLWVSTAPLDLPTGSPGWILKMDANTGKLLGHIDITEMKTGHSIVVTPSGEPVISFGNQLLWFKAQ